MAKSKIDEIVLYADSEHGGIGLAILGILGSVFAIAFLGIFKTLRSGVGGSAGDFAFVLSCGLGIAISLGAAAIGESLMKSRWHSGRTISLDSVGLTIQRSASERTVMSWTGEFSTLKWRFNLKGFSRGGRERRIRDSWFCFACQGQQDKKRFIVYTFVSPEVAESIQGTGDEYYIIKPADYSDNNIVRKYVTRPERPTIPTKVLTGEGGSYWLAERKRWQEGLELSPADFVTFVDRLDEHRRQAANP